VVNVPDDQVASRLLDRIDQKSGERDTLLIVLYKPKRMAEEEWACEYSIESLASPPRRRAIFGVDAMQALVLSLRTIHAELDALRSRGVDLRWFGDSDLGFRE